MDTETTIAAAFLAAIGLPLLFIGGGYYLRRLRSVAQGEGRVAAGRFGIPDLLTATFLIGWFLFVTFVVIQRGGESSGVTIKGMVDSLVICVIVVGGIIWSLHARGISLVEQFGLRELPFGKIMRTAVLGFLAVLPLVWAAAAVTGLFLGQEAENQAIVRFFVDAVRDHQWYAILFTILSAAVIAPLWEEFVFRGFLYGVLKRYVGLWGAIIFTSALFAAIHFNALSLPSLFLLAVCLTLLYELTGCLWVPMAMHALFNAFNLVQMLLFSRYLP